VTVSPFAEILVSFSKNPGSFFFQFYGIPQSNEQQSGYLLFPLSFSRLQAGPSSLITFLSPEKHPPPISLLRDLLFPWAAFRCRAPIGGTESSFSPSPLRAKIPIFQRLGDSLPLVPNLKRFFFYYGSSCQKQFGICISLSYFLDRVC